LRNIQRSASPPEQTFGGSVIIVGRMILNWPRTGWSLKEVIPGKNGIVETTKGKSSFAKDIQHVVLISIDTCRADHLGCYGYSRNTSPNIDALAKEGVLFNHAVASVPITLPSHSTMLTGTSPLYHKVHDNSSYHLAESNVTLAEILKDNGFATGAVIGAFVLDSQFGLAQGFDTYDDHFLEKRKEQFFFNERDGKEVTMASGKWLERNRNKKSFLFVHYYDPHLPFILHEDFTFSFMPFVRLPKDHYDSEIAYVDYYIGTIIKKLKDLGIYDKTLLIVTSDHGEGFNQHFELTHGFFVYHDTLHVPLVIKVPGGAEGRKINEVVGLVDIVPTICGLLGIELPSQVRGVDLSGHFFESEVSSQERYLYFESLLPTKYDFGPFMGVVDSRWKYIHTSKPELYDLVEDPGETKNLAEDQVQQVGIMQKQLKAILGKGEFKDILTEDVNPSTETLKRLESLGYVSSRRVDEGVKFDQSESDPKEFIKIHAFEEKFSLLRSANKVEKARKLCNKMLKKHPELYRIHHYLGSLSTMEKDGPSVKKHYSNYLASAESESTDIAMRAKNSYEITVAHNNVGGIFMLEGDIAQAIAHYNKALSYDPYNINTMSKLAFIYMRLGKLDEALKYCQRVLELDPSHEKALKTLQLIKRKKSDF